MKAIALKLSCSLLLSAALLTPGNALSTHNGAIAKNSAQESPEQKKHEQKTSESKDVSITVYNQNFGLVRDLRSINLASGINHVRFDDVAGRIDPTTVSFHSLSFPNSLVIREQNYQYDLMDQNTILSKSVGKEIVFSRFLPDGSKDELKGILLNPPESMLYEANGSFRRASQGMILSTTDAVVLNPRGQIQIKELPAGLVPRPSLLWKIESEKAGAHDCEIAYQTAGINWKCDYVAVVNRDDSQSDLTSWVTLDNKSGASYKNASLKLLAGDVHKVREQIDDLDEANMSKEFEKKSAEPQFKEESFAEYHLYSLKGKTDVNDNETKQMSLFNASQIPVKKLFVYEPHNNQYHYYQGENSSAEQKVAVKFELANSEKNHLGMPLPKGKVRVYKKDQDGALQFIGEDEIDHTSKDEKIRLYIGDAFDLVGERKQTNYQRISSRVSRYKYEIRLANHKDSEVTITAVEHCYGDWTVLNSSFPYTKKDSHTFEFDVKVAANSEQIISYEIEVR